MNQLKSRVVFVFLFVFASVTLFAADMTSSLKSGKAELKSASALAFGPDGVLFVGDAMGASIVAIDTGDRKAANASPLNLTGLNEKVAALLGSTPDQIMISDMAVNPISHRAYFSAS